MSTRRIAVVLALWLMHGFTAQARDITISSGGWPPFITEGQKHNGFIAHMISDIFADAGIQVTFVYRPWARVYQETALAQYDATAVWMDAPDRHVDFLYSNPVLDETFVFFHRRDDDFDWTEFTDLAGLNVGGILGYSYGPGFDAALADDVFMMERVNDDRFNFLKLLSGRIDVYPQEVSVGYYALKRDLSPEEAARVTHHEQPVLVNQSFLLLPKQAPESAELLAIFNEGLARYRENGRYQDYFEAFHRGEYGLR